MSKFLQTFPRYYVVEYDIFVKLEVIDGDVVGTNASGNPYPPRKAITEGVRTTESAFNKAVTKHKESIEKMQDKGVIVTEP